MGATPEHDRLTAAEAAPEPRRITPGERRRVPGDQRRNHKFKVSPAPVVIQRRARAARHARAGATAVRVAVLLIADLLVLSFDYSAADYLRSAQSPSRYVARFLVELVPPGTLPRVEVLLAVILGLALFRNYGPGPFRQNSSRLFGGAALGLSLVFWNTIWTGITIPGAFGFVLAIVTLALTLYAGRVLVQYVVSAVRPPLPGAARGVIIGSKRRAAELKESVVFRNQSRLTIIGFIPAGGAVQNADALGELRDLLWILDRYALDTVVIADPLPNEELLDVLKICDDTGCAVIAASLLCPFGGFVPRLSLLGDVPYVELYKPSLRGPQLAMKRVFDIVLGSILLVIALPILAVAAVAIALTSPGGVIFSQDRIGYAGQRFRIYKLRTMVEDAEQRRAALKSASVYRDERVFKVRDDPRVTPVGNLLRRTSIDELPQLLNVLRGEMSLVGPRPPLPNEVELYDEKHYARFDMKPGITGPWQVAGRNNVTCFDEIVLLDAAYLTDWTIWKDFVLLVKTVPAVLSMRGAV